MKLCPQPHVLYAASRAITDDMKTRFVLGSATRAKRVEELRNNLSGNQPIDTLRSARR